MSASIVSAVPQVSSIPFPSKEEPVTQIQLARVLSLRNQAAMLKAEIDTAEADIKTALESGAAVEPGPHTVSLKESKRRIVSWKSVAERLAVHLYGAARGARYCAKVLASTKPSVTISLEIQ